MEAQPDVSVDYVEVVDADSFRPVRKRARHAFVAGAGGASTVD